MPTDLASLPAPSWPGPDDTLPLPAPSALSDKDQLFVDLYRQTGDAMASAVRAKMFSPEYPIDVLAERTLQRPEIRAALAAADAAERAVAEKAAAAVVAKVPITVTQESMIADFQYIYEVAMGITPAQVANANLGAAISAKKIQSSITGLLRNTVDINLRVKSVDEMTDEELERIAKQGRVIEGQYEEIKEEE